MMPGTPEQPQETNPSAPHKHFDERMQLTLDDVKAFSGPRREMPPLAVADPKGQ